jgi:hypothetical protein
VHVHHAKGLDPFSSAVYFDGFIQVKPQHLGRDAPVAGPSTWLPRIGWRRHGLLGRDERPSS